MRSATRRAWSMSDAGVDEALNLVELKLADQRSELGVGGAGVAGLHALRRRLRNCERLVMAGGGHQHARRRIA
jgi:hypothetical protein